MASANDQVTRLLALTPYLRNRPGVEVSQVAADFGITRRQVLDDLRVLVFCGLPGGMPDDLIDIDLDAAAEDGVISLANADFLGRPARLTLDEAMGLIVALQAVQDVATGPAVPAVASALAKLGALVGGDAASRARVELDSGTPAVRDALDAALQAGKRIRLTYDGLARGETTQPVVDPGCVRVRDGVAYLHAYSLDRQAWRTYRLDRIAEVTQMGESAAGHGEVPADEPGGWFDALSQDNQVRLTLRPQAAWVAEYYPTRGVVTHPDGTLDVVIAVGEPDWLTGLLLRLGPQVLAVDPPQAGADAVARARAVLALANPEAS